MAGRFRRVDLRAIAREAMLNRGFLVGFSSRAQDEADAMSEPDFNSLGLKDLTQFLWSSIDNDDSRDLDQIEYAQKDPRGTRVFVAIADVDFFVHAGTALDSAAQHNTTSIYTGVQTFPMLPERLSTNLSSLNEAEKRVADVSEMLISEDGRILESSIYRAVVQNKVQLTYNGVAAWLDNDPNTKAPEKIEQNPQLQDQLRLQDAVAQALRDRRHEAGALTFDTAELRPVVTPDGTVVDLESKQHNRATLLIEDFMIASNQATASFLEKRGYPSIRRVVKDPEKWDRIRALAASLGGNLPPEPDAVKLEAFLQQQRKQNRAHFPELSLSVIKLLGKGEYVVKTPKGDAPGHFGLAVQNYSHSTAPNRRYPDLLTQRLVKAALGGKPAPYSTDALIALAKHCTEKEDDANKVERFVKKCAAAAMLRTRIGQKFDAIVTGANAAGKWARLLHPPVEGMLHGADKHLEVGDRVRVQLSSVDPTKGFIDFQLR